MGWGREALAAPKCFKTFGAWGAGLLNVLLGGWRIMLYRRGQDSSREQEEQRGGGQEMGTAGTARAGVGTTWEAHQANPGGQQPRQVTRSRR